MKTPDIIDLRSDTVTKPTDAMRHAMATCEVGDDVFSGDPTVRELERLAAEMVGSEASLWCPTGTMANQVAIAVHTSPGRDVIAGNWSHIVNYELGGVAWNSLCQLNMVSDEGGWIKPSDLSSAIRLESDHTPGTALICLENTHNRRGGRIMPLEVLADNSRIARESGVPVHLDGARIWNASVASGVPVRDYMELVDSMMFCLSKGLASPAGSMLCGKKEFITKARRMRKRFGGGLRQVGVLASCGIISLRDLVERLEEDHRSARKLAEAVAESGLLTIDPGSVQTNICIFSMNEEFPGGASGLAVKAEAEGLLMTCMGSGLVRMVTHRDFSGDWIPEVIKRLDKAIRSA